MNKTIILAIVVVLATSCKPQKIYIKTIKTERDSIYINKVVKEVERFTDTLTIESPCDSLGILKPFKQVISTKQGKVIIQNKGGNIDAQIDLKGYRDVLEKEYQSKLKELKEKEAKTIYKIPFKYWVILVLSLLLNATFIYLIFKRK